MGGLKLYPNPTNFELNIHLEALEVTAPIQIINAVGQVVLEISAVAVQNKERINLKGLPAGSYMVRVVTKNEQLMDLFLKF